MIRQAVALLVLAAAAVMTPAARAHAVQAFISVMVEDPDGEPVAGLDLPDFELLIDGRIHPIASVAPGDEALTIVCLVDLSASMLRAVGGLGRRVDVAAIGRRSLDAAMGAIAAPDRLRMGSFGARTVFGRPFSSDPEELREAVRSAFELPDTDRFGPSPIWDAVAGAADVLAGEPGRRAIVVVTDGRSTGNRLGLSDVIARAQMAGVAVNVIGEGRTETYSQDAETGVRINPEAPLRRLADETGGLYIADGPAKTSVEQYLQGLVRPAEPGSLLREIMSRLRRSYMLAFAPTARDGALHSLQIRVTRPNVVVHAASRVAMPAAR